MADPKNRLKTVALETLVRVQALLPGREPLDWSEHHAAVWREGSLGGELRAHPDVDPIDLDDLLFVDRQKELLERNTRQFVAALPANNVLLWGARGTGKSSLIHGLLNRYAQAGLRLLEVDKEALSALPEIAEQVREQPFRFIVVCDDLSFEADDSSYKALKSVLEGSVFKASENILIYATSNRRHLLPEYMDDNLSTRHVDGELHHGEAVEEKISLSDRFGIWLSFHPFKQDAYLDVVAHWLDRIGCTHGLDVSLDDEARADALRWALARGARNGRTAQYFARDWVGRKLLDKRSRGKLSGATD